MQVILTQKEYEDLLAKASGPGKNVARFPEEFVATRYPGYYFNILTKTLFSIKVSGTLRELKKAKPSHFNRHLNGYVVSNNGWNSRLTMLELLALVPAPSEVFVTVNER